MRAELPIPTMAPARSFMLTRPEGYVQPEGVGEGDGVKETKTEGKNGVMIFQSRLKCLFKIN